MRLLFIGERRSDTAIRLGVTWADGRLCAKNLHEALRAMGVEPAWCDYGNAWEDDGAEHLRDLDRARDHVRRDGAVVALGHKASGMLLRHRIPHLLLIHPAARGAIRKRERYQAHVADILQSLALPFEEALCTACQRYAYLPETGHCVECDIRRVRR